MYVSGYMMYSEEINMIIVHEKFVSLKRIEELHKLQPDILVIRNSDWRKMNNIAQALTLKCARHIIHSETPTEDVATILKKEYAWTPTKKVTL